MPLVTPGWVPDQAARQQDVIIWVTDGIIWALFG